MGKEFLNGVSMRLFGMPYQFPDAVDPRISTVNEEIGLRYAQNIVLEAPVMTIIPGKPIYLPGISKKKKNVLTTTTAMLKSNMSNLSDSGDIISAIMDNNIHENARLYDFQIATSEYFDYVNLLCRTGASFLDLDPSFEIPAGKNSSSPQTFDWRNWHWSGKGGGYYDSKDKLSFSKKSDAPKFDDAKKAGSGKIKKNFNWVSKLYKTKNFIQFYIDPDINPSDSFSNSTSESQLLGMLSSAQSGAKELKFLASAGGIGDQAGTIGEGVDNIATEFAKIMKNDNAALRDAIGRFINLGADVVKGNNLIVPEIYQSSGRSKNYSITVHLKTPFGNKYSYYLDIFVPMMHLLALSIPKAESANSYSEPFLIKMDIPPLASTNLGIVEDISISKATDTLSVDGLPTEVDVTISVKDLYTDLTMNHVGDLNGFINNVSLVEYLTTNCGLNIINPTYSYRYKALASGIENSIPNILAATKGSIADEIYNITNSVTSFGTKALGIGTGVASIASSIKDDIFNTATNVFR